MTLVCGMDLQEGLFILFIPHLSGLLDHSRHPKCTSDVCVLLTNFLCKMKFDSPALLGPEVSSTAIFLCFLVIFLHYRLLTLVNFKELC